MATQLTADDAKQSLTAHVAAKGDEICAKYGPNLSWKNLQLLLQDRAFVRYPCEIVFDASQLNPGEVAFPVPNGHRPEDGFTLHVHPLFMLQLPRVPHLALYQLVTVNYGEFASADDAETFGAAALGLSRDEYYDTLCSLADQLCGSPEESEPAHTHEHMHAHAGGGCGGGGGGCGGGCSG
jgi:hypothetical protein